MNVLKKETEQKIIDTAREVFIEKGLQGARMQDIADRAGINKALLHYYFRSKDKLFDAVFEAIAQKLFAGFRDFFSNSDIGNIEDFLPKFIQFYNNVFMENPFLPQFFFHEIWQHPEKLAAIIRSQEFKPEDMIEKISKRLPKIDGFEYTPQHMVANLMGMVLFPHIARPLLQRVFFNNDEGNYNEFIGERSDFLTQFIGNTFESNNNENNEPDENF